MEYLLLKWQIRVIALHRLQGGSASVRKSLYDWVKRYGDEPGKAPDAADQVEIKRLKAELRRVTEERDILKKATAFFAKDHGWSTLL